MKKNTLLIAGIAGFYLLGADAALLRAGAVLGCLVVAVVLALTTEQGRQLAAFVGELTSCGVLRVAE